VRVLMTGGYGCIGSWVARRLVEQGREVWIYDLEEDTHRLDLLLDADQKASVHFVPGDVSDAGAVLRAAEQTEATHLLHLAGLQVPTCRANPLLGATVNVLGTLAVFEAARVLRGQIGRVAYASSAAVHGPPEAGETVPRGDRVQLEPVTHYGAFKVCNELNARVYALDHGITSVGLRPWTVYGVGRDFGISSEPTKAIKAVAAGRDFAIGYGGLQDLQYAPDVADAFLRVLTEPFEGAESFNVRGAVVPIETFVATFERIVPEAAGRVSHGERQLPICANLDDTRLETAFGPLPRTSLERGIRETYDRFVRLREEGRLDLSDIS
jgi:nucleoside-diphosphate-sugar epimerase